MGHRDKLKSDSEWDALTKAKRFHHFKAGVRKWIKRAVNKRARKWRLDE